MKNTKCPYCNTEGNNEKHPNGWYEKTNGYRVRHAEKGEICVGCDFPLYEGADYIYELNMGIASGLICEKCWLLS